jgi:hypothetical protein
MVSRAEVESLWSHEHDELSLQQAAQIAYETAEKDGWLDVVCSRESDGDAQLNLFKLMMLVQARHGNVSLTGIRPPSTQRLQIPKRDLSNLYPDKASNLCAMHGHGRLVFRDVCISRRDLNRVIETYKTEANNGVWG